MDQLLTLGNLTTAPQSWQSSTPALARLDGPVLVPIMRKYSIPNFSTKRNLRWAHIVEVGATLNHRTPSSKAQVSNVGTTLNHPADHAAEKDSSPLSSSENDFSSADVKQVVPELHHELRQAGFVDKYRRLYRQKFPIRSYEAGADKEVSISTIFSFFQEVVLCQIILSGISGEMFGGIGATKAMNRLGLIWVVAKVHVEVEQFPKWPEVIEIDSRVARAGKTGIYVHWTVRRCGTNEVLIRATSTWCMMHSTTRRLCKMPAAVEEEFDPYFVDDEFLFQHSDTAFTDRIPKLDDLTAAYRSPPQQTCREDLDSNQHVSNHKYVSWVLQSVPEEHMETHDLKSLTVEYRRECHSKSIFESLTSSKSPLRKEEPPLRDGIFDTTDNKYGNNGTPHVDRNGTTLGGCSSPAPNYQFLHLLQTIEGSRKLEIARARTTWKPKQKTELVT